MSLVTDACHEKKRLTACAASRPGGLLLPDCYLRLALAFLTESPTVFIAAVEVLAICSKA